ncbi:glycoside hydrolase family 20 protein [Backusella circina FSU 941]|nr:glycoside hydrolase family 20 protein [Backusella circina FSU 941]
MKHLQCLLISIALPYCLGGNFLWPIPQSFQLGNETIALDSSFHISGSEVYPLQLAINRYTRLITNERWSPVQVDYTDDTKLSNNVSHITLSELQVHVEQTDVNLDFGVNESYRLIIPSNGSVANLTANTVWGALHGLETFSQLIQTQLIPEEDIEESFTMFYETEGDGELENEGFNGLIIRQVPILIEDAPKYSHRGLMLDTARNFFPVKDILRTIDAMAYNKMNVFHWHITDSQSFPLKLKNTPELALQGAYKLHQKRLLYTTRDVNHIIQYANNRGVRVIPEIDMPAHTGSWGEAYKNITTCTGMHYLDYTNDWENRFAGEPGTGQLNPVNNQTYEIVGKVIREMNELFPDSWYHGGGDEPVERCWEQDASVRQYMVDNNATGTDLLGLFLEKELEIINDNHLPLPKDVVLQVWTNPIKDAISLGHRVIASNYNFWYLDCGHGGWESNNTIYDEQVPPEVPSLVSDTLDYFNLSDNYAPPNWGGGGGDWCSPYKSWQRVYSYDLEYGLNETEVEFILGGEVGLWSEQTDENSLDNRLWPRAAAAGEVLWSGRYDNDNYKRTAGDAMPRFFDWRYRLVSRGIKAAAVQPLWCASNPHLCDDKNTGNYTQSS